MDTLLGSGSQPRRGAVALEPHTSVCEGPCRLRGSSLAGPRKGFPPAAPFGGRPIPAGFSVHVIQEPRGPGWPGPSCEVDTLPCSPGQALRGSLPSPQWERDPGDNLLSPSAGVSGLAVVDSGVSGERGWLCLPVHSPDFGPQIRQPAPSQTPSPSR